MALSHVAGGDGEAEVVGEVLVARVQDGRFADDAPQDRGLKVIYHGLGHNPAEEGEGVGVAGQEVLHCLGEGELDIQHAAVAEHHDEEAEPSARVAHVDRSELAPVHLGAFARGEGQRQEGRRRGGANLADVVLDDRHPAGVAGLA